MNTWDDDEVAADVVESFAPLADGIHRDVKFENYLKQDRVSKSKLWIAYNQSPAHAVIEKPVTGAMLKGTVTHTVLLEPDMFRQRFTRGPDDRKGNKWKDAVASAAERGMDCLTSSDFDNALMLRDIVKDIPEIKMLTGNGAFREITACATDPVTGLKTRARADAYVPGHGIIVEVKTTNDARAEPFARTVKNFGYHMGEAHYTKTWMDAGGENLKGTIFIALEPEPPFALKIYELDADTIAEGEAIREKAMATWAHCVETGVWPAYSTAPEALGLRKYDFRETVPLGAGQ